MLVLNLRTFKNKKGSAYDHFHGDGPYGEIPTKKEPIRTLGFAMPYIKCLYVKRQIYHAASVICLVTQLV